MKEKIKFAIIIVLTIFVCYLMAEYKLTFKDRLSPSIIHKVN
jgi:hypothetical protein